MAVRKGRDYYCVPGFESVGTVIALGDTIKEAIDLARAAREAGEREEARYGRKGLDPIVEEINKGKQYGINF